MRVAGSVVRNAQDRDNAQRLRQQHQFRILCLGESTTAGEAGSLRYPEALQKILNRQNLGVSVVAINMGRSGAVTSELVEQLETEIEAFKPNIVVAMMGINDGGKTHAYGTVIEPGRGHWYGSSTASVIEQGPTKPWWKPTGSTPITATTSRGISDI